MKLFVVCISLLFLVPSISKACSCSHFPLIVKWDISKNIFLAAITHTETDSHGNLNGYFTVEEVFKGSAEAVPYFDINDGDLCGGMNVDQGETFILVGEDLPRLVSHDFDSNDLDHVLLPRCGSSDPCSSSRRSGRFLLRDSQS